MTLIINGEEAKSMDQPLARFLAEEQRKDELQTGNGRREKNVP